MNFFSRLTGRMARRSAPGPRRRLLFILGGASHNWQGPGLELYRAEPAFRACVEAADEAARSKLGFSSTAMFRGEWSPDSAEEQRRSDILIMGLLHLGLIDLWAANGIRPEGAIGLSLGEVGAAYAAGAIDRGTAIRIYCAIAGHVEARTDEHILFVVEADAALARELCADSPVPLHFAGEPVPGNSALLTPLRHGGEVRSRLDGRAAILAEHETKWPYHAPTAGFDGEAAAADLAGMEWRRPDMPVYLASLGRRLADGDDLGPRHWASMVSGAYLLAGASRAAFGDGFDLMVNIGTASIGEWVIAAAPAGADVRRFDATPGGGGAGAWKGPLEAVRALHRPPARKPRPAVDLDSPESRADPFAAYERLRAAGPAVFLPRQNFWILLGYDAVEAAFRDTERLSNRAYERVGPVLMAQDPPDHRNVRRRLSGLFAPARIEGHLEEIAQAAERLTAGRFDLVAGYARPLAQAMACRLLGIPPAAAARFRAAAEAYHGEGWDIQAYVDRLDLLAGESAALADLAGRGADPLDEARARQLVRFLWMAATETSERVIVRAMLVLLEEPALRARIQEDPGRLDPFVDEVLRLYPPEMMVPRTSVSPVRFGRVEIPAGAQVMLCLAAANRDPACFESPAEFRLDRRPGRHLSFGAGIHKCSGTAMARPIVAAGLAALLRHAPGLRVDEPLGELEYHSSVTVHTPRRLRVAR